MGGGGIIGIRENEQWETPNIEHRSPNFEVGRCVADFVVSTGGTPHFGVWCSIFGVRYSFFPSPNIFAETSNCISYQMGCEPSRLFGKMRCDG